jgi:hypothetical protein
MVDKQDPQGCLRQGYQRQYLNCISVFLEDVPFVFSLKKSDEGSSFYAAG